MSLHTLVLAAGRGSRFIEPAINKVSFVNVQPSENLVSFSNNLDSLLNINAGDDDTNKKIPKQLVKIYGQPMVQRAVDIAAALTPGNVTVVLGHQHHLLQPFVRDVNTVVNPHWYHGIGNSIAYGVSRLPSTASAVLIFLCDQVALRLEDLQELKMTYEHLPGHELLKIVCAEYQRIFGVPAIFPRAYFSCLGELDGDRGAKQLLYENPVITVPLETAAVDIDTYEQWMEFTRISV